ncbi:MAG: HEPN domain-containing protein [Terriglobia bacterium]
MNTVRNDLALRWLKKAENDIVTARQTLSLPDGPTDTVAFHAQQAAEKALKALLTFQGVEFPKIHDLVRLVDLAAPHSSAVSRYREDLAEITNYAVQARYPDEFVEPARDDAAKSLHVAMEIVKIVKTEVTAWRQEPP